jgi:hypothetical protein
MVIAGSNILEQVYKYLLKVRLLRFHFQFAYIKCNYK